MHGVLDSCIINHRERSGGSQTADDEHALRKIRMWEREVREGERRFSGEGGMSRGEERQEAEH